MPVRTGPFSAIPVLPQTAIVIRDGIVDLALDHHLLAVVAVDAVAASNLPVLLVVEGDGGRVCCYALVWPERRRAAPASGQGGRVRGAVARLGVVL